MKLDYKFSSQEQAVLRSLVGKRLDSYRLNSTDNSSFEIFVLRFPEMDIEVATKEIVGIDEWFDETNTVEISNRPNRDSWSRLGKSEPDNGIPAGGFLDYVVSKVVRGISVAVNTMSWSDEDPGSGDYIRGIVLHFDDEDIVFDKGPYNWECFWHVIRCSTATYEFKAEDNPETPEVKTTVRTEKIV